MPDDRVERALDVVVYGPLGLGLWLRDLAPSMIDTVVARGRAEVDRRHEEAQQRITTARSMGQVALAFGVPHLRKRAEQQLQQVRSQADRVADTVVENVVSRTSTNVNGGTAAAAPPPRHAPTSDAPSIPDPVDAAAPAPAASASPIEPLNGAVATATAGANGAANGNARSSSSGHLPIPGYDALSASQVVERLAGLDDRDLRAVREYELHNRNRRTILGKIDQLTTA